MLHTLKDESVLSILNKKWKQDIDEVNDFLDQMIRDYEQLGSESGEKPPRFSVHEIHRKKFKRSLVGFNIDEVNDFIDQFIIDYDKGL